MSLVMLLPLLIGGFNGCGYTAKVHPSTGETKRVDTTICQYPAFRASFSRFCPTLESRLEKKNSFIPLLQKFATIGLKRVRMIV